MKYFIPVGMMAVATIFYGCVQTKPAESAVPEKKPAADKIAAPAANAAVPTTAARTIESKKPTAPAKSAAKPKTPPKVIAIVQGKEITGHNGRMLFNLVFASLSQQYAKANKIEPTQAELEVFLKKVGEMEKQHWAKLHQNKEKLTNELKSKTLSQEEQKQKTAMLKRLEKQLKREQIVLRDSNQEARKIRMAKNVITNWKTTKALYEKYHGRMLGMQGSVIPIDAYRQFLQEQEKQGAFKIVDKKCETEFWQIFADINDPVRMPEFYSKEKGEEKLNNPWWLQTQTLPQDKSVLKVPAMPARASAPAVKPVK